MGDDMETGLSFLTGSGARFARIEQGDRRHQGDTDEQQQDRKHHGLFALDRLGADGPGLRLRRTRLVL